MAAIGVADALLQAFFVSNVPQCHLSQRIKIKECHNLETFENFAEIWLNPLSAR